jgi:methylenetetrahydrofolate reductase (NADPH)
VRKEGIRQCAEIIQQVRQIPGVAGVHVMAIEWEEAVPEILALAGLEPRPQVWTNSPSQSGSAFLRPGSST